nr:hypothetical protein [Bacteroidota bacterium]
MKKVTSLLLMMLFITSSALFSQNAGSGLVKKAPTADEIAMKMARMEAASEPSLGLAPAGLSTPSSYSATKVFNGAFRGEVAYADNVSADNFYSFNTDDPTAVTVIGPASYSAFCGDFAPGEMDVMYIIDYNDDVLKSVDIATGVATDIVAVPCPMAGSGGIWSDLAIDKTDGTFYATATDIAASNLYIIDPGTGGITLVGSTGIAGIISCTIDLTGVMYAFDIISDNTYSVDLSTGAGTLLGPAGFDGNYAQGMGYDAVNDIVYLASYSTLAELRSLNTATGATTLIGALPGETGAFGFPYMGGPAPNNDVGVSAISQPTSGADLTATEPVEFIIKNYGVNSQSDIPWEIEWNGPVRVVVNGTFPGPLAQGETGVVTLVETADLSAYGDYTFNACTQLIDDENPGNDCKVKTVTNALPEYCDASTTNEDEFIANVLFGDINNTSGWQGGVADYTDQAATILAGGSEPITITNGTPWTADIVICWVDWNMNFVFDQATDEEYPLLNVGGAGATFTGDIAVPAGTPDGDYRMRIRMTYSTAPVPCGVASYGEIEDYTITVSAGFDNDLGVTAVLEPASGFNLTSTEPVTITIKNFGAVAQSNFDVSFDVLTDVPVVETVAATIEPGATLDYTFTATANLSAIGAYNVTGCTMLAGDQNTANDCKTVEVLNQQYAKITGSVMDAVTSAPIGGALIEAGGFSTLSVATPFGATYNLYLPPGTYNVT